MQTINNTNDFKEALKDAICAGDLAFLEENREKYSMDDRLEDENNDTLLLYSLSDANSNTYQYFLKNKADISLLNGEGENVIHSIVYSGEAKRLNGLLNDGNINHQSKDGTTPLLLAIALEKDEIAQSLMENGADINISDNDGNAPVHIACHLGKFYLVSKLVGKGANLRVKTKKGNFPLALAVNGEHDEIVKFLFKKIYN
ncbi:MAG TPA: ankyrin repeat domain-containing protein [Cyclobacteriaceae bacterium]|nr:ankyrin repeat domain-containing protein [Cyclobacteriaceae bacterium]